MDRCGRSNYPPRLQLFFAGPSRFGKITILKTSEDRLSATDAVVLRFDAES
jgi:hypothetical protein